MSANLTDAALLTRNPEIIATECEDEFLLLSIARGRCYGMNPVGAHIWRLLETPTPLAALLRDTQVFFESVSPSAGAEIRAFVENLETEGLVVVNILTPEDFATV